MVRLAAISVLAVIVFPATSLANTFIGQKDDRGDQEMLLKRIESLEKEIKILKSLVKSHPAVKPNGSNELASSEFDRNKDFEADFAGSYIGIGIGAAQFTGSSDISIECNPVCQDNGDTYHYPSLESLYGDLEESTSSSENFISLELGKNWGIGNYIIGINAAVQYGKGERLKASFEDIADLDVRSALVPGGGTVDPATFQEKNTLTITPSSFKSELSVLVGRPFARIMPYLYAGVEGRQFTSELENYYHTTYEEGHFEIGLGDAKEKDFSFAPVVGAGLSYALSPRLQLDWKAGWSFHELHTAINSHTITEFSAGGDFTGSTSYDNSTTSTKTDLTEFQVGFGVKYFF